MRRNYRLCSAWQRMQTILGA